MRWNQLKACAFAGAALMCGLAMAETYQIDFGSPGHVNYTGADFGNAAVIKASKEGEKGENFSVKGIEYKLGDAVLSAEKVGAFSVDGETNPEAADALTKSFIFANPANPDVGAVVELKLSGVKPTDKVTFAFIRAAQPFNANVTVVAGDKKESKDVTTDAEFTTFGVVTGQESYTIQITHLADAPSEADIAGARITIEPGGGNTAPADKPNEKDAPATQPVDKK